MFTHYGDHYLIPKVERYCPIVCYVPWCTETDSDELIIDDLRKPNKRTGIHIGSLEDFKNAPELVKAIPLILDKSETDNFIVVGPGKYSSDIIKLADLYTPRLKYIESVPRLEALRLLRSAGYGYTQVIDSGIGFVGDCWGTGTPLITTHDLDGLLQKDVDTLIANDLQELPQTINSLINSEKLYNQLKHNGLKRYKNTYTARAVGEEFLKVLSKVIDL